MNVIPLTERSVYDTFPGSDARCFIQWKGTEVCMDFYCDCGKQVHIDADFTYNIRCPFCKQIYQVGTQVQFIKITEEKLSSAAVLHEPEPDYEWNE